MTPPLRWSAAICSVTFSVVLFHPSRAVAHCDGLDGPVVRAAEQALATDNLSIVLPWVGEQDEREVEEAFRRTLAVRRLGPEAARLADSYFYETVVRLHRSGEGEPYTGLKPAGRDLGPAIPAADAAVLTGDADALLKLLDSRMRAGIEERLGNARRLKAAAEPDDVAAGRRFVEAYVVFIHFAERLYEAATTPVHGHYPEPEAHGAAQSGN